MVPVEVSQEDVEVLVPALPCLQEVHSEIPNASSSIQNHALLSALLHRRTPPQRTACFLRTSAPPAKESEWSREHPRPEPCIWFRPRGTAERLRRVPSAFNGTASIVRAALLSSAVPLLHPHQPVPGFRKADRTLPRGPYSTGSSPGCFSINAVYSAMASNHSRLSVRKSSLQPPMAHPAVHLRTREGSLYRTAVRPTNYEQSSPAPARPLDHSPAGPTTHKSLKASAPERPPGR